jgi:hypothetical protein
MTHGETSQQSEKEATVSTVCYNGAWDRNACKHHADPSLALARTTYDCVHLTG